MSIEDNKAIVGRWFTDFWGESFNPAIIDELAHPDIRFGYSLHRPLRGRDAVREFATGFRAAFPDLAFDGTAELIAEGDFVVGQWIGGGTHTGAPMTDLPLGGLPQPQHRQDDAVHRHDGAQGGKRPYHGGDRPRRRRQRPRAAGADPSELGAVGASGTLGLAVQRPGLGGSSGIGGCVTVWRPMLTSRGAQEMIACGGLRGQVPQCARPGRVDW